MLHRIHAYRDLVKGGAAYCECTDEMLAYTDTLVDGEFVEELKDISLKFRGSSNQRIIENPSQFLKQIEQ